ncbi:hypothetical protein CABS01_16889 [Colletotrichum abscissum]|uniref:uncharacterized protein n=1 Tax=Colletotrichum abscissum TaxID=1671311 RepID=UPI0027D7348C|nr:uncharacterized protein CABS01_16889 [Colletotrichum abscissum]KAK1506603.1 hypothetical protein CABS01_16889 [Colletotrichum abscissum]
MEIWAFANLYTTPPTVGTVQSPSSTVTELPQICTCAMEGDVSTSTATHATATHTTAAQTTAAHTTATHTTALPNRLESSHRFWNTTIDHNTSSISTAISLVTATSGGDVQPSWTYHRPTAHTTSAIPVSATSSHGAGCDHLAAFFIFFLGVYVWDRFC